MQNRRDRCIAIREVNVSSGHLLARLGKPIPARDSLSSSIGVDRSRLWPSARTFQAGLQGATPRCSTNLRQGYGLASHSRDANTGASQDFTGLAAAVHCCSRSERFLWAPDSQGLGSPLRLRVALGLQALQRCSGLLNRRARGSTVATHHFPRPNRCCSSAAAGPRRKKRD